MSVRQQASIGELRPSQLLFTFGVGALIDLPNLSVIVTGLDDWSRDPAYAPEISEERLLAAVRKYLGPQVGTMCSPPRVEDDGNGFTAGANDTSNIGVPVAPFPRWLRCPKCDLLSPIESGLFEIKIDRYHPDRTRYVHVGCPRSKGGAPYVLPVRFLIACKNGHLDDFPWVEYVHKGRVCPRPLLRLREFGVSGDASDIEVHCETCASSRRMGDAFGPDAFSKCRARRPHLRDFETKECSEPAKTILLGASNSWFPITLSALSIPSSSNKLTQLVDDSWALLGTVPNLDSVKWARDTGGLPGFTDFSIDDIWSAIQMKRSAPLSEANAEPIDLKSPEWDVLSNPESAPNSDDFRLTKTQTPEGFENLISQVVLVERLREVRSLVGFTRVESPPDCSEAFNLENIKRAPLARKAIEWVPAVEVRGEGIFIQFRESSIAEWCSGDQVASREREFYEAHREWRRVRHIEPDTNGFPGIRYVLLHSFAHAIMRQFALECGYTSASVRERIYSAEPESPGEAMAGVLLYTAAPDSEGTLGGLVSLGHPEKLRRHISQALEQIRICASDPLCSEHTPSSDGFTLHGAVCHACLFSPETACERGNRYLDRSVLIRTYESGLPAFFDSVVGPE
ncbi:MAG: DUF1998 domain-containing protein [Armatimonadetes bacterium]|nr:DUF1998 domain-containing protein [Armatimonadota bacterium]